MQYALTATALLLLAGCSNEAPTDAPKLPDPLRTTGMISITPASYSSCPREKGAKGAIGTVRWDARGTGAHKVNVMITARNGTESTFASGQPVGSKQTGPWMIPNVTVVLRDRKTNRELARVVAGSLPCESGG